MKLTCQHCNLVEHGPFGRGGCGENAHCRTATGRRNRTIMILSSMAGHYLGTWSERAGPICRVSVYFQTEAEAQRALDETAQRIETFNGIANGLIKGEAT